VSRFEASLGALFGERVQRQVPLARFTTFRVGGPADWLIETRSSEEIVGALRLAAQSQVAVTMLGGGSNVLVSDAGVRGLVIRPRGGQVVGVAEGIVRADASVSMNALVRWAINHGRAGLEAWAGTPGTVGGAIFGNAHFGGRLIAQLVSSTRLASRRGDVSDEVRADAMGFGYDRSRLQETGEILLSADFRATSGDPAALRKTARASLSFRKRTQPLDSPSAGCVFQNPQPGVDKVPDGIPWSAGALVDRAGLKGTAVGDARVSLTHGNFIVNDGSASAAEIRQLIEQCKRDVRDRFGVSLREEIVYLGEW
jgi:UDP-N-acetylmuramate dehydrogenase